MLGLSLVIICSLLAGLVTRLCWLCFGLTMSWVSVCLNWLVVFVGYLGLLIASCGVCLGLVSGFAFCWVFAL